MIKDLDTLLPDTLKRPICTSETAHFIMSSAYVSSNNRATFPFHQPIFPHPRLHSISLTWPNRNLHTSLQPQAPFWPHVNIQTAWNLTSSDDIVETWAWHSTGTWELWNYWPLLGSKNCEFQWSQRGPVCLAPRKLVITALIYDAPFSLHTPPKCARLGSPESCEDRGSDFSARAWRWGQWRHARAKGKLGETTNERVQWELGRSRRSWW